MFSSRAPQCNLACASQYTSNPCTASPGSIAPINESRQNGKQSRRRIKMMFQEGEPGVKCRFCAVSLPRSAIYWKDKSRGSLTLSISKIRGALCHRPRRHATCSGPFQEFMLKSSAELSLRCNLTLASLLYRRLASIRVIILYVYTPSSPCLFLFSVKDHETISIWRRNTC
jgi:hypothetical protein